MQPSRSHARPPHLLTKQLGDVDKLGGVAGVKAKALADHQPALSAWSRSSRVAGAGAPDAAAEDISSMACAKATWTAWEAALASSRDERARQRSPIRSVGGAAARPPRPWRRTPSSTSAAASASLAWAAGSWEATAS